MTAARKQFDWESIHKALDRRLALVGASFESDETRARALLKERSAQLAAARDLRRAEASLARMLVFRAAGEKLGLPLQCANEITPLPRVARVPRATSGLMGIINWRGELVALFDTARLLTLVDGNKEPHSHVIVLRDLEPRVGLAISGFDRIDRLDPAALQAPDRLRTKHADLFKGVTPDAVFVFDEERLMAKLQEGLHGA